MIKVETDEQTKQVLKSIIENTHGEMGAINKALEESFADIVLIVQGDGEGGE